MVRSGDEEGGKKRSRQGHLNGENGLNHLSLSFLGISRLFSVASSSVSGKLVRIFCMGDIAQWRQVKKVF